MYLYFIRSLNLMVTIKLSLLNISFLQNFA